MLHYIEELIMNDDIFIKIKNLV